MNEEKYDMYSLNGEEFHEGGKDDLFQHMLIDGIEGIKEGETYWLAFTAQPRHVAFINPKLVIDLIAQQADEDGGDLAERYMGNLYGIPTEKQQELAELINDWLDENVGGVPFRLIAGMEEITFTQEDRETYAKMWSEDE